MRWLLTLVLLWACGRKVEPLQPPIIPFKSVQLLSLDESEGCPTTAGLFVALAAGPVGAPESTLRLLVGCEPSDDGVTVHASAELEVQSTTEPEAFYDGAGHVVCKRCDDWHLLLAVGSAIRYAMEQALAAARLANAPDAKLVEVISNPDAWPDGVLLTAIDMAGDRRLAAAVQPLLSLLDSADTDRVLRAIGVLGVIGDTAAVKPLGKMALSTRPYIPHVALRAIADIGGVEARRALEVVANQSTDPVIVAEARDLLSEMDGRGR